jgi:hypothetical protein
MVIVAGFLRVCGPSQQKHKKSPLYGLLYLNIWLSSVVGSVNPNNCQPLPANISNLFLTALDNLEARFSNDVDIVFEEAGLGPLGTSLWIGDIYNFRGDLFEKLFGTSNERELWINNAKDSSLDIYTKLNANVQSVIGADHDSLTLSCVSLPEMYTVDLTINGSIPNLSLGELVPQIALLPPGAFLPMGLKDVTVGANYVVHLPFKLYPRNKIAHLGETKAVLTVRVDASISEMLPILPSENISFIGDFDLEGSYSYSSIQGFLPSGSFDASLDADLDGNMIGLKAHDNDIFDNNPRE